MIAKAENPVDDSPATSAPRAAPTVWGLDPVQLHDRFWAQHGVQVVRPDEGSHPQPISGDALLYLLVEPQVLVTFESGEEIRTLYSSDAELTYIRVHDPRGRGYRERVITDSGDNFLRFERSYNRPARRLIRAAFTPDRRLAEAWRRGVANDTHGADGWTKLRERVPRRRRSILVTDGVAYDRRNDTELARLVRDLTRLWAGPGWMIPRAAHVAPGVWADTTVALDPRARFVGPVWIGAGRKLDPRTTLIGPFVLWDDPAARPQPDPIVWPALRHLDLPATRRPADALAHHTGRCGAACKRAFDVCFALVALAITLPFYPLICLAIWLEDGRPFFFAHRRETRGGREFPCLKFRSMHSDAERMKQQLAGRNQADGPQFFMVKDVRVTRVGRLLRKTRLDELPQFLNVLLGHMSVVGPRPSPYKENQFCPPWREARLSVRPGITGLWQVKRTRKAGQDFQEWIRYDIEYVENASFWLDVAIIFRTVMSIVGGLIPWRRRRTET
ncbi:MAG: putative glycosyltransferase [Phycisphaerales bacterium]|nr:putative glycosyltransferase [Phycisphaerales bacterium]